MHYAIHGGVTTTPKTQRGRRRIDVMRSCLIVFYGLIMPCMKWSNVWYALSWRTLHALARVLCDENPCTWILTLVFTNSINSLQLTRPSGFNVEMTEWISACNNQFKMGFVFVPRLKSKYNHLILSTRPQKSAICPWWLPLSLRGPRSYCAACAFTSLLR